MGVYAAKRFVRDTLRPVITGKLFYSFIISLSNSTERSSLFKKWNPQILYLLSSANFVTGIALDSGCKRKSSFQ